MCGLHDVGVGGVVEVVYGDTIGKGKGGNKWNVGEAEEGDRGMEVIVH